MFRLELRIKNLLIREYRINDGDMRLIGRDTANHIVVDEPEVSRNHAGIVRLGNHLFIWDEGSTHGTIVNGIPVICAELKDGDNVSIGMQHNLRASVSTGEETDTLTTVYQAWQDFTATM